jgi:hypothetical protein
MNDYENYTLLIRLYITFDKKSRGIPVVRPILLPLLPVLYATAMLLSEAKRHSA